MASICFLCRTPCPPLSSADGLFQFLSRIAEDCGLPTASEGLSHVLCASCAQLLAPGLSAYAQLVQVLQQIRRRQEMMAAYQEPDADALLHSPSSSSLSQEIRKVFENVRKGEEEEALVKVRPEASLLVLVDFQRGQGQGQDAAEAGTGRVQFYDDSIPAPEAEFTSMEAEDCCVSGSESEESVLPVSASKVIEEREGKLQFYGDTAPEAPKVCAMDSLEVKTCIADPEEVVEVVMSEESPQPQQALLLAASVAEKTVKTLQFYNETPEALVSSSSSDFMEVDTEASSTSQSEDEDSQLDPETRQFHDSIGGTSDDASEHLHQDSEEIELEPSSDRNHRMWSSMLVLIRNPDPDYISPSGLTKQTFWSSTKMCPLCPNEKPFKKTFRFGMRFLKHLKDKHAEQTLKCTDCDWIFLLDQDVLDAHNAVHDLGSLTCTICGAVCPNDAAHYMHLVMKHFKMEERPSKLQRLSRRTCEICNGIFSSKNRKDTHMLKHLESFHCSLCTRNFTHKHLLLKHIIAKHERDPKQAKPFLCPAEDCDRKFVSELTLKKHQLAHDPKSKLFSCGTENCFQHFRTKTELEQHILQKHTPTPCDICGKNFFSQTKLKRHQDRSHPPESSESCPDCGRVFKSKDRLEHHSKLCHKGLGITCEICGYGPTDKKCMELHTLRIHNREQLEAKKRKTCYFCQHSFLTSGELYQHMVTHTGERPHICGICGADFTQSHVLTKHLKQHQSEPSEELGRLD